MSEDKSFWQEIKDFLVGSLLFLCLLIAAVIGLPVLLVLSLLCLIVIGIVFSYIHIYGYIWRLRNHSYTPRLKERFWQQHGKKSMFYSSMEQWIEG
jgi:hypothetical protein